MKRVKNGTGFPPLLQSYVEGQKGIPYRKELNLVTGWATASILLQQMIYWSSRSNPFYKFQAPCNHELYAIGDSWQEEMGFSRSEFEKAIKCIGTRINKGDKKSEIAAKDIPQSMILYWTDRNRVTWWELNVPLVNKMVEKCLDESARLSNAVNQHQISKGLTQHQVMMKQRIRFRSENNSENNSVYEAHTPDEDQDLAETQDLPEQPTPVNPDRSLIEGIDLGLDPENGLGAAAAKNLGGGGAKNAMIPVVNAPVAVEKPVKVQQFLNLFIQAYNANRGNWRSIGVAPAPIIITGINSYRQGFGGTDAEFLEKFPLLMKAAQAKGGKWLRDKLTPSSIFNPDRLPLNDFWDDIEAEPPAPALTAAPPADFKLDCFLDTFKN